MNILYIELMDYLMEQRKNTYIQWRREVKRGQRPITDLLEFEMFKGW